MYHIFYKKQVITRRNEHPIANTTYAPPSHGGALRLNPNMIDKWPILGELAYLKMVATVIIAQINIGYKKFNIKRVATGPILHEMKNVNYARYIYKNVKLGNYRAMCIGFISVNSMSLIVDAKGQHNDYFNKGGESFENKILFVVKDSKLRGIGRGGSLESNVYVMALLDWQWQKRTARSFFVAHANEMGMNASDHGAQRRLTQYFETNPNNPWEHIWERYRVEHSEL